MLEKSEIKYILYAVGFALLWFSLVLPFLIEKFGNETPLLQFLLFNVGLIIFLQIYLKSLTLNTSISIQGSIGFVLLFIGLDILQPPYAVLKDGTLISEGPVLIKSSADYIAGLIAQSFTSGYFVYLVAYVVIPFILLFLAAKLIPNFVRNV